MIQLRVNFNAQVKNMKTLKKEIIHKDFSQEIEVISHIKIESSQN